MAQTWTDDVFDADNVAVTDMANVETNFAAIKSFFSGTGAPSSPVAGMPWYYTTSELFRIYDGTGWIDIFDLANERVQTAVDCTRSVLAGDGITGGGALTANRTLTLGTPGSTSTTSTNAVTTSSHTHALAPFAAGSLMTGQLDAVLSRTNTSYECCKSFLLPLGGTLTIDFDLRRTSSSGGPAYARVYRNGSAVGTARTILSGTSFTNYSQTISGWSSGDRVELYAYNADPGSGSTYEVRNFRLYANVRFPVPGENLYPPSN